MSNHVPLYVTVSVTAAGVLGGAYLAYRLTQNKPTKLPETWEKVGNLKEINVYPIKSCGAILLNTVECTNLGCRDGWLRDRTLMVVDEKNNFITARGYPELFHVFPTIRNSVLTLTHAKMDTLHVNLAELYKSLKRQLYGGMCLARVVWPVTVYDCGREASEWFSRLIGRSAANYRLVYYAADSCRKLRPGAFKLYRFTKNDTSALAEEMSFHLINEASGFGRRPEHTS